ncbi:hypothetical protein H9P43_000547 [Blastocladiella emersonii ATCC 22665]|nr:hypothetical protein H9P43_000547 [Blastocladiella emersonii ATCC 22665]
MPAATHDTLVDVAVLGGGPVGLFLGNLVHEYLSTVPSTLGGPDPARRVLVVERADGASPNSKAIAVHARTLEVMASLGPESRVAQDLVDGELPYPDRRGDLCAGSPIEAMQFGDFKHSSLGELNPPTADRIQSPYPYIMMRPQFDTERLLIDEMKRRTAKDGAIDLRLRTEVVGLRASTRHAEYPVEITLRDLASGTSRVVFAKYAVGCDGGRSTVRHLAGIALEGHTREDIFWMADVRIRTNEGGDRVSRDTAWNAGRVFKISFSRFGTVFMMPLQGDHLRDPIHRIVMLGGDEQVAAMGEPLESFLDTAGLPEGAAASSAKAADGFLDKHSGGDSGTSGSGRRTAAVPTPPPTLAGFERLFNARLQVPWSEVVSPGEPVTLDDPHRTGYTLHDAQWLTRFRVNERVAAAYGVPAPGATGDEASRLRVFLAGDAAHVHSPAGGMGMNLGLQDAQNLAFKLAAAVISGSTGRDTALATYGAERRPMAQAVVANTSRLTDLGARFPRVLRFILGTVLPFFARWFPRVLAPEKTAANVGLATVYPAKPSAVAGEATWVDAKAASRVTSKGGVGLLHAAGHRGPARGLLQAITTDSTGKASAVTAAPLDLIVASRITHSVLLLAPHDRMDQVKFTLPSACANWCTVQLISLRTTPPAVPHCLTQQSPVPLIVTGSDCHHGKLGDGKGRSVRDAMQLQRTAVPAGVARWEDANGDVAQYLFGTTHHHDFGVSKVHGGAEAVRAWALVVRPDGIMAMAGLGITGDEVAEFLAKFVPLGVE